MKPRPQRRLGLRRGTPRLRAERLQRTFELWFKDEHPAGYNHGRARLLTKGDISAAEGPFFAYIASNVLTVGVRAAGTASDHLL